MRLTPIASECSPNTGLTSSDMATFESFEMSSEWMCYAVGFLAKTSATPASVLESTESVPGSGLNMSASFANYDPATSSWRTSQRCLDGEWAEFSETFPRAGTMRNGTLFERPTLVPRTEENGFGLWPTPDTCAGGTGPSALNRHSPRLQDLAKLWPTPNSRDWKDAASRKALIQAAISDAGQVTLPRAVAMWPTLRAADFKGATQPSTTTSNRVANGQANLPEAVQESRRLWPTPQAADNRDRGNMSSKAVLRRQAIGKQIMLSQSVSENSGALNPMWVEWLMGYPPGWTDLRDSETPSCLKSALGSENESLSTKPIIAP